MEDGGAGKSWGIAGKGDGGACGDRDEEGVGQEKEGGFEES